VVPATVIVMLVVNLTSVNVTKKEREVNIIYIYETTKAYNSNGIKNKMKDIINMYYIFYFILFFFCLLPRNIEILNNT